MDKFKNFIYFITKDNEIKMLEGKDGYSKFICGKCKRLMQLPLKLVLLTTNNEIKVFGGMNGCLIDYRKSTKIEDIGYEKHEYEIVIKQNNNWFYLFENKIFDVKDLVTAENEVENQMF